MKKPRLSKELELERSIFLARMGTKTRQRAICHGTIEVTEDAVVTTTVGCTEAGGVLGWPLFGQAGSWAPRQQEDGTVIIDGLVTQLSSDPTLSVDPWGQVYVR